MIDNRDKYVRSLDYFVRLCASLDMDFVCDDTNVYRIVKDQDGENRVYIFKNNQPVLFDDRGDLFIALRNVAVNIVPNTIFRNEDYIYNK